MLEHLKYFHSWICSWTGSRNTITGKSWNGSAERSVNSSVSAEWVSVDIKALKGVEDSVKVQPPNGVKKFSWREVLEELVLMPIKDVS